LPEPYRMVNVDFATFRLPRHLHAEPVGAR
jgi:hypothetical protein